jgi:hypothetical protein
MQYLEEKDNNLIFFSIFGSNFEQGCSKAVAREAIA